MTQVFDPRQNEEQIREPVHTAKDGWCDRLLKRNLDNFALGPAYDRPCYMQGSRTPGPSRKDERAESGKSSVMPLNHRLDPYNLLFSEPKRLNFEATAFRPAHICADVEQIVLHP